MDTDELDAELDSFRVEKDDGVARVTLDSGKANPLSEKTLEELFDASVAVNEDDDVRCVVLTGTDGFYCSGFDLSRLDGSSDDGLRVPAERDVRAGNHECTDTSPSGQGPPFKNRRKVRPQPGWHHSEDVQPERDEQ